MNNIKEPIQKRAIKKKLQIIDSAKIVFDKIGYHNTHIKDITTEAGISVGLFYKYFKDKNDIYLVVLELLFDKEMEIALEFKKRMLHENDKKNVLRCYIDDRLKMTVYKNIIEEFHVLSKKYEPIKKIQVTYKDTYMDIIKDILNELWDNPNKASIEVRAKLFRSTIYSNVIEIANLKPNNLKELYIDLLTDTLYKIIVA